MTRLTKAVHRITATPLDGTFLKDRSRRLVVTLRPGDGAQKKDMLELRPQGTRRTEKIAIADVYRYAIHARVNLERLEKARHTKARRAAQRLARRITAADKRLKHKALHHD